MNINKWLKTQSLKTKISWKWSGFKQWVWREVLKRCPRCKHKIKWVWELEEGEFGALLARYKIYYCADMNCTGCQYGECDEELFNL